MIAQVIVDIPSAQLNRTFDYLVPEEWQEAIELGMRVEVNFGRRVLMGIVVGLSDQTDFAGQLKPLVSILDYRSYLNQELIDLSFYLKDDLHAFQISILQAMLPSLLKVKYETTVKINDIDAFCQLLPDWNREKLTVERSDLEKRLNPKQIKKLADQGIIDFKFSLQDQKTIKTEAYLFKKSHLNYQELLESLNKQSKKQALLLSIMMDVDQSLSYKRLEEEGISRPVIKATIDKGWFDRVDQEVYRDPLKDLSFEPSLPKALTHEQSLAYQAIAPAIREGLDKTFLIEGVTGSGKTEVYLQLMDLAIKDGKTALLLVPEIALTPQMVERVVSRFGSQVAVLHSALTTTEKFDEWQRIIKQEAKVVVGARSSIFAPLENLGLIIIDEEHETSYKQSDNPRYHARDVAKWRSGYNQIPLVLGSATPSLESRARAQVGNYQLIPLPNRINGKTLPPIEIIDMTEQSRNNINQEFSLQLLDKIQERLEVKQQIVLMLNRRGYAAYLLCRECGYVVQCPNCDISLTYHKSQHRMKCHYCNHEESVPSVCPKCQSPHIRTQGLGTQKIAESLEELFPHARVIRMDNDTTQKRGSHQQLLDQFGRGGADILLGTQMIAKGLDFENVTLVGVINADTSLNIPDFRASERTFQLLTQVSGRAGRGELAGEVIIQTYNPDHYVIRLAQKHDYENFFFQEMKRRHLAKYPPYYFTSLISVVGKNQGQAFRRAHEIKSQLSKTPWQGEVIILGPSPGPIARINQRYHYQIFLKYKDRQELNQILTHLLEASQEDARRGLYVSIDHEPQIFI
ncbi:primosomal protein N' [Hutsoniella sourekii]|uniref:primosomal protein N' n=1 Tax=Hutsoniella sourekii TaxID=87650 RepID=UPI00048667BC|nr:primosomal protein N' [Hutsoniella sourekii]